MGMGPGWYSGVPLNREGRPLPVTPLPTAEDRGRQAVASGRMLADLAQRTTEGASSALAQIRAIQEREVESLATWEMVFADTLGAIPLPDGTYIVPGEQGIFTFDELQRMITGDAGDGPLTGGGGGGSGGGGRMLFPEEQEALRLENEFNRRILAGELGFQEIQPGVYFDPLTQTLYDRNQLDQANRQINENVRQFDLSFEEGVRQFNKTFEQNDRHFDASLAEDQYQFDRGLAENQFQFDVSESRLTEGMRRERSLEENEFVRQVLSNPADFVARAFLQRGAESPTGAPLTQADLISAMAKSIQGNIAPDPKSRESYLEGVMRSGRPTGPMAPQSPTQSAGREPRRVKVSSGLGGTPSREQMSAAKPLVQADANQGVASFVGKEGGRWTMEDGHWVERFAGGGVASPMQMAIVGDPQKGDEPNPELVQWTPQGNIITPLNHMGMDLEDTEGIPKAAYGTAFLSPLLQIGSQQQILDVARQYSPPAVNQLLDGGTEQLPAQQLPVPLASARQTSRLTGAETEALGTRLAAEGTSLEDYADAQRQLFGDVRTTRKGRLVI